MAFFFRRRNRQQEQQQQQQQQQRKQTGEERLRKLDKAAPTRTLEDWWAGVKKGQCQNHDHQPEVNVDGQFICVICLDSVLHSQEIRELKCLHVFHQECLEKWYLKGHYDCPLCHRTYFVQGRRSPTGSEWVWMV